MTETTLANDSVQTFTESKLRDVIRQRLNLRGDLCLTRTPTGKFNDTFFLDGPDTGNPLVVRIAPPEDRGQMLFYEHMMMRQEPHLHRLLRANTSMPVPEIIHFEERNEDLGRDLMVMERLPGGPMEADDENLMEELGRKLREVHERIRAEPGCYGYLGAHRPMEPQETWDGAFRVMWNALLDDIENCGGESVEQIGQWRELLEKHAGSFKLYQSPARLLHMDIWSQNILTDGNGCLTGLVDWDRALWGDPEIEFAVLEYCGISTPSFWRGYGEPRPSGRDANVRRQFYLLYEILKYIVIRIARNQDSAGAERFRVMARRLLAQL